MDEIKTENAVFYGSSITMIKGRLLFIKAAAGVLGCGYFNIETADKLSEAMAVVTGVKNYDDMLNAAVIKVSAAAAERGVTVGMSGLEALLLMN